MNVLLIVLCALIFIMALYGYRKGCVKMLVPVASGLLALLVIVALREPLLSILFHWTFLQGEHVLARVVVILILYFLVALAFKWSIKILNLLTKLPIVHGMNKLLGLFIGIAEGVLLLWLCLYIIQIRDGFLFGRNLLDSIADNSWLLFMYENNLVAHLMDTLFGGWIL